MYPTVARLRKSAGDLYNVQRPDTDPGPLIFHLSTAHAISGVSASVCWSPDSFSVFGAGVAIPSSDSDNRCDQHDLDTETAWSEATL